jgi:RimJ/RimL family protein N-acetyltransferase
MRISLRPWQKPDRHILAGLANNIRIWNNVRDRLPHPYTLQHADAFIAYCAAQKPPHVLAVMVDDHIAGCIGLEMQTDISRLSAELGYWIGEPFWNKGIATEAVKQMLEYTSQHFPSLVRIYAGVFEKNKASMRVLEKAGFYLEGIQRQAVVKSGILMDHYIWVKLRSADRLL